MPRSIEHMLPQRATISRPTRTPNGKGGHTETLEPVKSRVPCRLGGAKLSSYLDEDGKLVSDVRRDAWFLPGQALQLRDVLTIDGKTHTVNATDLQADGLYRKAILIEEQS